jgi:hypothetical protein
MKTAKMTSNGYPAPIGKKSRDRGLNGRGVIALTGRILTQA